MGRPSKFFDLPKDLVERAVQMANIVIAGALGMEDIPPELREAVKNYEPVTVLYEVEGFAEIQATEQELWFFAVMVAILQLKIPPEKLQDAYHMSLVDRQASKVLGRVHL